MANGNKTSAKSTSNTIPQPITRLTVTGIVQPILDNQFTDFPQLQPEKSIVISTSSRGEINEVVTIDMSDDHLLELVFEDNTTWLCTPGTLEELYPGQMAPQRGADAAFSLPLTLQTQQADRGIIQQIALKVVNLFIKKEAATGMQALAENLEDKQLGAVRGLCKVSNSFELTPFNADDASLKTTPALVFIHGTNSSSKGSFGELPGSDLWNYINQTYKKDNILAFQHETLTKSPLQNAVELVKQLPKGIELHLITHSRGGLVGEILARCADTDQTSIGFSEKEIAYLSEEGRDNDIKHIKELQQLFREKRFKVSRFIRVACPTGGTTILSKRLDHFFNISLNLLGLATGALSNPIYVAMKNLLTAVIDQKNHTDVLPGLEAMKPDSPFIIALNNQDTTINFPVVAISGNCKAKVNFRALLILAEKLFFMEDNDLVVNTGSMYAGSKRLTNLQYFFDEGTDVDHFHYFKNKKTNTAIQFALQSKEDNTLINGFTKFSRGLAAGSMERQALLNLDGGEYASDNVTGKRPIVILLPGIMGSCLTRNFENIWLNYLRMLKGDLLLLDTANTNIKTTSIVKTSYKKLGDTLSQDYDVVTFAYDWRLSSKQAAASLEEKIKNLLSHNQPIKIVAHSLGGVVVRDFMAFHQDTWRQLNESQGFRLLFMGTPLMGSFRIINVLMGEDDIINKLSKLDLLHSKKRLLQLFSSFPGILGLLPLTKDGVNDFANGTVWANMAQALGEANWPIPKSQTGLSDFEQYRNSILHAMDGLDFSNAVYIAGQDKQTPCGYRIDVHKDNRKELVLLSTAEGDQSVTWNDNIPASMIRDNNVYYVNHTHGALSNSQDMFSGIKEILEKGKTRLFSTVRPSVRGDQKIFRKPLTADFDLTAEGVEKTLLGLDDNNIVKTSNLPIRVSISHGDCKYAAYPLLLGHFKYDSILYAEKRANKLLAGQLEEMNKLGIYPGDIGTSEVILTAAENGFQGVIIAGIGDQDKLTAFDLSVTTERAASKYLLIINGQQKLNSNVVKDHIGISPLMIGCGYGGQSIESSVQAILQGITNANKKIAGLYGEKATLIEEVEFIEQYQDRVLGCFYAIHRIGKEMTGMLNIIADEVIRECNGARQKVNVDQGRDWWNRITINGSGQDTNTSQLKGLNFSITTGAAREELQSVFMTGNVVEQLIESISVNNNWSKEKAATIFELLMPNEFKSRLKRHGNIAWVLDKETAAYPWELLQHKGDDVKPLCINAGMIRQLATGNSRINIQLATTDTALIIGDPDLKGFLPQLPGALEEAKKVNELLSSNQFDTNTLLRSEQEAIVPALMSGSYKIIHLAGHGVFDAHIENASGMVIGKDNFLTTRHLKQMSDTPELVFVNCCFLGKTDAAAEKYYQSRFKLAANIGTQLIENGVKAVIVAGWAVDDQAALLFANEFYQHMLQGKTFGDAVRLAREAVYNYNSTLNTWGAYQCYGDPFYRLRAGGSVYEEKQYVISMQAETDLTNLYSDMRTGDYTADEILFKMKSIIEETDNRKLRTLAITEMEAKIYYYLNKFDESLKKYEVLVTSAEGGYSFSAMEQYCDLLCRKLRESIGTNAVNRQQIEKDFDHLKNKLNALIQLNATAERYSLQGSSWKKITALYFNIEAASQLKNAIRMAADAYRKASEINFSAYNYINWVLMETMFVQAGLQTWGGLAYQAESNDTGTPSTGNNGKAGNGKTPPHTALLPPLTEIKDTLKNLQETLNQQNKILTIQEALVMPNIKITEKMLTAGGINDILHNWESFQTNSYQGVWKTEGAKDEWLLEVTHLGSLIRAMVLISSEPVQAAK